MQNNLHELWALLNFLVPKAFPSPEAFDELFEMGNNNDSSNNGNEDIQAELMTQMHKILQPLMLRRLKADVAKTLPPKTEMILYVGLSALQVWFCFLLFCFCLGLKYISWTYFL